MTYGDYTTSKYSCIQSNTNLTYANSIYTFYLGEELDFSYIRLGEVEAHGDKYATDKEIKDKLMYQAWMHGANGIINIQSDYKEREEGYLFDEESVNYYSSKYYQGIAVKIDTDSYFVEKYGQGIDTSFVKNVEEYNKNVSNKSENQLVGSVFATLAGVFIAVIANSQNPE